MANPRPLRVARALREILFKKAPIAEAIEILQATQRDGATHAQVRVRWEIPKAGPR